LPIPKQALDILEVPQEVFATGREERPGLAELHARPTPATIWSPRLTPILTLLQELLADLFAVRDQFPQAQHRRGKQAHEVVRQYARDRQWLNSLEEQEPFSFVWVCHVLGLEASAVRRHYLSGQPVSLPQRHRVDIPSGHLRLESGSRRASKGKARALRHTAPLNGQGHKRNGTDPAPQ
jgi:hypothetical protein